MAVDGNFLEGFTAILRCNEATRLAGLSAVAGSRVARSQSANLSDVVSVGATPLPLSSGPRNGGVGTLFGSRTPAQVLPSAEEPFDVR